MEKLRYVVGIGSSAGGLEALQEFLSNMPDTITDAAFIIAQHLSPSYKSRLVELLSRVISRPVLEIRNGMEVEPGKIYITPPDNNVVFKRGKLYLQRPDAAGPKPSVDVLLKSLAIEKKEYSVGIILSGTGKDGSAGIREIKNEGGITVAQEPSSAKYDSMPLAAIQIGKADFIFTPDRMGGELEEIFEHPGIIPTDSENPKGEALGWLLHHLGKRTGVDFRDYKPNTIGRRLEKRLMALKITSLEEYMEYVERHPEELDKLFQLLLIGVTQFFRDKEAFEALKDSLKHLLDAKRPGESIRVWIAGCASGEEAYSIAIMLSEILGSRIGEHSVQVFATDIDENAIETARKGIYSPESVLEVPHNLVDKYFTTVTGGLQVSKNLRQMILFSRHDLTENPPFLRLDLISCRNLLIYFNQNLQQQVFPVFHYALNPRGILFLGRSESVGSFTDLFDAENAKHRMFRRRGSATGVPRFSGSYGRQKVQIPKTTGKREAPITLHEMLRETFYSTFEDPYVVINGTHEVIEIVGDVSPYMALKAGSLDTSIFTLLRPELPVELRTTLVRSLKDRVSLSTPYRLFHHEDETWLLRVVVKPLLYADMENDFYAIIFNRVEVAGDLSAQVGQNSEELRDQRVAQLEIELTSARESLQNYIEELETSNEELQSLNEEMQSTNEELQSSNEELETSNEELQASNEEIQVAYAELRTANSLLQEREAELEASRERLELALWGGDLGWWEWNVETGLVDCSDSKITMLGYTVEEFSKTVEAFTTKLHPEDFDRVMDNMRQHLEGKTPAYDVEYRIQRKDGSYIWYWDKGQIVSRTKNGKPLRLTGIVINVDRRKRSEIALTEALEEREVLIREVHHRVKNNFQTISSILELQLLGIEDPNARGFIEETRDRLTTMALIHREMYDYDRVSHINLRGYLESLMDHILYSYPNQAKDLEVKRRIDELYLPTDTMIPLALILNELLTNSFKYAFRKSEVSKKSSKDELFHRSIHLEITSKDGKILLLYKDNGLGYPNEVIDGSTTGVGMRLIRSLSNQVKGVLELSNSGGAITRIEMPDVGFTKEEKKPGSKADNG